MSKEIKSIGVLTSGGDSSGMNPCIRSVVRCAIYNGMKAFGVRRGYQGLIEDDMREYKSHYVGGILDKGGTTLHSSRCPEWREEKYIRKGYETLKRRGIDALVTIGGDGSYRGANDLYNMTGMPVICIPGTIDNDIYGTDYTIGYDTAVNVAVDAIDKIRDTAYSHNRLFLVEVMGRHAGYIALEVGISSGAEDVLIPEMTTEHDTTIKIIQQGLKTGKLSSIVVVAEGDDAGGAYKTAEAIRDKTGYDIRVSILGHLQRGGTPTSRERLMASRFGYFAIEGLKKGLYGHAVGFSKNQPTYTPLGKAIQKKSEIPTYDKELLKALAI